MSQLRTRSHPARSPLHKIQLFKVKPVKTEAKIAFWQRHSTAVFCIPFTDSTVTSHSPSCVSLKYQSVLHYASVHFDYQETAFYSVYYVYIFFCFLFFLRIYKRNSTKFNWWTCKTLLRHIVVYMWWCTCLMCVSQLRQVSQAKRWDDVGTGRRTIRQSRIVESLEFTDEDLGVNLGIVSAVIWFTANEWQQFWLYAVKDKVPQQKGRKHSPLSCSEMWEFPFFKLL